METFLLLSLVRVDMEFRNMHLVMVRLAPPLTVAQVREKHTRQSLSLRHLSGSVPKEKIDTSSSKRRAPLDGDFVPVADENESCSYGPNGDPNELARPPLTSHTDKDSVSTPTSPQEKIRKLHALIEKSPDDVDAWLKLVRVQRELLGDTNFLQHPTMENTLAQMELSVIQRALDASRSNVKSMPLLLTKLKILADRGLWPDEKIQQEWQTLLTHSAWDTDELIQLWLGYVAFRRSSATQFRLDDVARVYADAVQAITQQLRTCPTSDTVSLEKCRLDLIFDMCQMLQSAGTPRSLLT